MHVLLHGAHDDAVLQSHSAVGKCQGLKQLRVLERGSGRGGKPATKCSPRHVGNSGMAEGPGA